MNNVRPDTHDLITSRWIVVIGDVETQSLQRFVAALGLTWQKMGLHFRILANFLVVEQGL